MAKDLINRYVWIVDTLRRYGRLSRSQLERLWLDSSVSNGEPLPRRTFFYYRRAIEDSFNIVIACDKIGRYYIDQDESARQKAYTNWLMDSVAVNSALRESGVARDRVEVEEVPSARDFLPVVVDALRMCHKISFTYAGFNRSRQEHDIMFRPYFLKRYKQRWYMVGLREKSGDIRTYALDRVRRMHMFDQGFEIPADLSMSDIFGDIIGITSSRGEVRRIVLRTSSTQAKYLRALPLHHSQSEEVHDNYSVFSYNLKINWELVHEIVGMGKDVMVVEPPELRLMVTEELRQALAQYDSPSV